MRYHESRTSVVIVARMWGFQRLGGAVLWYILVVVRWYHSQFLEPVVTWWLDTVLGVSGVGHAGGLESHLLLPAAASLPSRCYIAPAQTACSNPAWCGPAMQAWEESVKAFVRESFATTMRLLNGAAAWTVSVFFKQGYFENRKTNRRLSAWKAWWADRARTSTFDSVLERDGLLDRSSPSPMFNRLRRTSGRAGGAGGTAGSTGAAPGALRSLCFCVCL